MIKNYFPFLIAFFGCISFSNAQLIANDDYAEAEFSMNATLMIQNVLANDTLNGEPATFDNVTLTPLSFETPYAYIDDNGEAWYTPTALVQPNLYIMHYRIAEIANPFNWQIGTVVLRVDGCLLPDIEITNTVQLTCDNTGSVTFENLPAGNWVLSIWRNGILQQPFTQGSGSTYTLSNIYGGYYTFSVGAGCLSMPVKTWITSDCVITFPTTSQYIDLNQDGAVSPGDAVNFAFTINNGTNHSANYLHLTNVPGSHMIMSGEPFDLGPGESNSTGYTGVHMITQDDINQGYTSDEIDFTGTNPDNQLIPLTARFNAVRYLNISDGLRLSAFVDENGNGTQDVGEPQFTDGNFHYEINNDGTVHHVNTNGILTLYENNPANSYDFGFAFHEANPYYSMDPTTFENITVAEGSGITHYNFPITIIPHDDLAVYLTPSVSPRPGFHFSQRISYRNNGTSPMSGTVSFHHSNVVSITSISQAGTTASADGFDFAFSNLLPNETRSFYVVMLVPTIPTVALGQVFENWAELALAGDVNPADNSAHLSQIIVGSYDPNDKTEVHGGKIVHADFGANDFLTYTIRFENTGTAEAFNVRVSDVLDEKLDENSVRMIEASHDYVLDRVGSNLTWRLNAINLPPSVPDTMTGHGFITFTVKPKAGYAIGDIIPNSADIFFDFNPAITTEPCLTEFVAPLGINTFADGQVAVYPNPTKNVLNIAVKNDTIGNIQVTDLLGKTVWSQAANANAAQIDLSVLSKGLYLVKVQSAGKQQTFKVVKE